MIMKKIFRLPGFITFVVLTLLITLGSYFFADSAVKWTMTSSLESATGAQVDVENVNIQFTPFALTVNDLQIADPDNLNQNQIQLDTAEIKIDWLKFFQGKTIIENIEVSGAAINQPRKTPAKAIKQKEVAKADEDQGPSALDKVKDKVPSATEIMANEDIQSIEQAKALEALIKQRLEEVEQGFKNLPTDKQIKGLSERLDVLLNTKIDSLDALKTQSKELKDISIQAGLYKKAFIDQKKLIKTSQEDIKQGLADLKAVSKQDFENIKNKYSFDQNGLINITQSLFGDQYGDYLDQAIVWYDRVSPYLSGSDEEKKEEAQRINGRYVDFKVNQPLPDFLLSKFLMQLDLKGQAYELKANHITDDQSVINEVTPFSITKSILDKNELFQIQGYSDRIEKMHDHVSLDISGVNFDGRQLFKNDDFSLDLTPAKGSVTGQVTLTDGIIDGDIVWGFNQTSFDIVGKSTIAKQLRLALEKINQFDIKIELSGPLKNLKIEVSSDLDGKIGEQIKLILNAKKNEITQKIQLAVTEKIDEIKKPALKLQSDLKEKENEFEEKQDEFNKEVEAKLEEAEQKAKDKLASLKGDAQALIDAEKAKLKAQADRIKAQALAEKKRLEDEAAKKVAEAKAQADKVKAQAQAEKDRLADEAKAKADKIKAQADVEAARIKAEADKVKAKADAEKKAAEDKAKKDAEDAAKDKLKSFF